MLKNWFLVPADCRVIELNSSSFRVDQSILTGESVSVSKDVGVVKVKHAVKQDMVNIIFSVGPRVKVTLTL
jgi:P-type Ca2+ transporter type 2A